MIPSVADQALRAMVWLGTQPVPRTRDEIAAGCGVPVGCLVRLLAQLTRARLLASRRGRNGGYALRRPAGEITLHDVVVAVHPDACSRSQDGAPATGLERTLADARQREDDLLRRTSLATVLRRRSGSRALSAIPLTEPG